MVLRVRNSFPIGLICLAFESHWLEFFFIHCNRHSIIFWDWVLISLNQCDNDHVADNVRTYNKTGNVCNINK